MKKNLTLLFVLFNFLVFAQPPNDNYADAIDVTSIINSCSANAAYTTVNATADGNDASCWNTHPDNNVWFKFQAPASGQICVEIKRGGSYGTISNINAAIWQSDGTTQVACNRYVHPDDNVVVEALGLTAGNWYYLSVDNYDPASQGTFTLCLNDQVDYDFYEGAVDVSSLINGCSAPAAYSTSGATPDRNAASCWNAHPNYNRWFKFQAPPTGRIRVEVKTGGSYGTMSYINAAIWEADGTTEIACNRYVNSPESVVVQSLNLTPGNWYYISVDNYYAAGRGSFTLCLQDDVDYDFYEGAKDITSLINNCSPSSAYTTVGATADRNAASCWNTSPDYNRWFKFQAPSTGQIRITVQRGSSGGTIKYINAAIWEADGTTEISCNRYINSNDNVIVQATGLTPGNWYYLSVDNRYGSGRGSFKLCVDDHVDYDYYEGAVDITGLFGTCSNNAVYTTKGATPDRNAGSCWDAQPNYNRWFKFQAPSSGQVKITVKRGGAYGTVRYLNVAVWDSDGTTELACNRYNGANDNVVVQALNLTPGNWYYVSVDNNYPSGRGTFTVCLEESVDYDFYEGAIDVTGIINSCSADGIYSTEGASPDRSAGSCWNSGPNYNRWFKFQAPSTGQIQVKIDRGGTRGNIQYVNAAIWEADGTTQVACNTYENADDVVLVQAVNLTPGNWYYISVDNDSGSGRGSFTLCLNDQVDYDFYEGAIDVTSLIDSCSADAAFTTVGATADRNAGSCWDTNPDFNRWFKFQAPSSGSIRITVDRGGAKGSVRYLNVALWESDGVTEVDCKKYTNPDDVIVLENIHLTPGNWYYISVDNLHKNERGTFTLCLKDPSIIWTGNTNLKWDEPTNWNPQVVPGPEDNIIIPSGLTRYPAIMDAPLMNVKNMIVQAGARVTVTNGHDLIIENDAYLLSNQYGTASLIDFNTDGGHVTVTYGNFHIQRYVKAGDYHYMSTPLANQTTAVFAGSYAHYYFDETLSGDDNMAGWQWADGDLEIARGYAVYFTHDKMVEFVGPELNSGNYKFRITFTDGSLPADARGYNLVGNPYPSAIDADAFINDNSSEIEGSIYFWNDADGDGVFETSDYAVWNGAGTSGAGGGQIPNGKIAAHQGFMVKAKFNNAKILFRNQTRDPDNQQYFRPGNDPISRIKVRLHDERYFSDILVAFKNDATMGFDSRYDGRKMAGRGIMSLYTMINGTTSLAIQTFPRTALQQQEFTVPVYYNVANAGNYTIDVTQFENFDNVNIYLLDQYAGQQVEMTPTSVYRFHSDAGEFDDRFVLIFRNRALDDKKVDLSGLAVYPNPAQNRTEIMLPEGKSNYMIRLTDMQGKEHLHWQFREGGVKKLDLTGLAAGVYLLQVRSDKTEKVLKLIKK